MADRVTQKGFTLIEILVIMALAAILIFFAWPSLSFETGGGNQRRMTAGLVNEIQEVRSQAILSGRPQALRFDFEAQQITSLDLEGKDSPNWRKTGDLRLDGDLRLVALNKDANLLTARYSNSRQIVCFPSGVCESAVIGLSGGSQKYTLWVQPHVEKVRIQTGRLRD